MSVIERLNANVGKSPDEIVIALIAGAWYRYVDMTPEERESLRNKRVVAAADNHDGYDTPFWVVTGLGSDPYLFNQVWVSGRGGTCSEFWFILWDDYNGFFPDGFKGPDRDAE